MKNRGIRRAAALLATCIVSGATLAGAAVVTVTYQATAVTVSKKPFGLDVPRLTTVEGYFTFDTGVPDADPADAYDGEYPQNGNAGFVAEFPGHELTGSSTPFYWVDLVQNFPQSDTFRIYDGPRAVGFEGGVMSLDGNPDEDIEMFLAVSEDVFDNDHLIDPFPLYDFTSFIKTPHTFSLGDDQGTMLLELDSVAEAHCGDVNGAGGVTTSDALQVLKTSVGTRSCLPCLCDVDHSGTVLTGDALKTLKYAVEPTTPLVCSKCL